MRSSLSTKSFQELEGEIRERQDAIDERRYWDGQLTTIDDLEAVEERMFLAEHYGNDRIETVVGILFFGAMALSGLAFFGALAVALIWTAIDAIA